MLSSLDHPSTILQNTTRLRVLRELELVDSPAEEAFDRLTRLASRIVGVPVSLVSIVDADRQFFKSFLGLGEPWASRRETPLSHSFCQHVVTSGEPLIVTDAREHPLVKDNLAIPDLNVIGYLGMPLTTTDGHRLGSFCVIDTQPHQWTPEEIEIVRELAHSVMSEIELRTELKIRLDVENALHQQNRKLARLTEFCRITLETMQDVVQRGSDKDELLSYLDAASQQFDRI